jgi:hypothetical protein
MCGATGQSSAQDGLDAVIKCIRQADRMVCQVKHSTLGSSHWCIRHALLIAHVSSGAVDDGSALPSIMLPASVQWLIQPRLHVH